MEPSPPAASGSDVAAPPVSHAGMDADEANFEENAAAVPAARDAAEPAGEGFRLPALAKAQIAARRARPRHTKRGILFAYHGDPDDVRAADGVPYWTMKMLSASERVSRADGLLTRPSPQLALRAAYHKARREAFWLDVEPEILEKHFAQLRQAVRQGRFHGVFSPCSRAATHLGEKTPVVLCAAAPFGANADSAPEHVSLVPRSRENAFIQEKRALERCAAVIYPSRWAADAAVSQHGADPRKIHVAPFGANVPEPDDAAVAEAAQQRTLEPVRVVAVARSWSLDRAAFLIEACRLGWPDGGVRLDLVVGPDAPGAASLPGFVHLHEIRGVTTEEAWSATLSPLLAKAALMVAPAFGAAYDLTAASAAAWGVPVVSPRVGAMDVIVDDGRTGLLLPTDATAREYGDALRGLVADADAHRAMGQRARARYTEALSWDHFSWVVAGVFDAVATDEIGV